MVDGFVDKPSDPSFVPVLCIPHASYPASRSGDSLVGSTLPRFHVQTSASINNTPAPESRHQGRHVRVRARPPGCRKGATTDSD